MSNKSGASEQIISLPKGGGALHGIGEKFSPDLFTGTGNFTVPIALPLGRNGFQPQLKLVYSTGNGNSPFGLGWSLSIPGVTRKTSHGIPRYHDYDDDLTERDTFILSGAEDLVPISKNNPVPGIDQYCPRTEGLFALIEHHHDAANNYWKVCSKDGLVSIYGHDPADQQNYANGWMRPAISPIVAKPDDPSRIFAWKLSLTKDTFGNRIEYIYKQSKTDQHDEAKGHYSDHQLLQQIRYVDFIEPGGQLRFLITVSIAYEDRTDRFSEYRAGYEIRTVERCKSIRIETHFDTTLAVREYRFTYDNQTALNGVSLLKAVQVIGFDDAGIEVIELPPLTFDYTKFEPQGCNFQAVQGMDLPPYSLANPNFELADLTGDGLPDILEMNGMVRYWRNVGSGCYDLPRPMRDAPPVALADAGVQMIDANGDGRADLLVSDGQSSGYYPLDFDGRWNRSSFQPYSYSPSLNLEDPEVKLVDLDGDGLTDVVHSGTRLECYFNNLDRRKAWTRTAWVERKALEVFPNLNFSDPRVKWGDMTGDSLQDILLVYDGNIEYWPNLGYGRWGQRIHMENSPRFRDQGYTFGYDPRRILVGDVDGDGLADIAYVDNAKVILWINQSGNAWSEPIEICGTPPVTDMDAVRLVDLLGNGISGVLWSSDVNSNGRPHMYFLDFTGGVKPYLLDEMDHHLGATTKVEYCPSTRFYLEDRKNPKMRWRTTLPFPVQVVASVEVIDAFSKGKLTTVYRYHHGYWDGAEREFRGFGMVEQLDTETFEVYSNQGLHDATAFAEVNAPHFSPPTLSRTWFHQGPVEDASGEWYEPDHSEEYWAGDPHLLNHTENVNAFLKTLRDRASRRDALRTLRGSILRTELYALDRLANQDHVWPEDRPYTVSEQAYSVHEEKHPLEVERDRKRIFFPHGIAKRTTQWERGDDPMTSFSFSDNYDAYGQPRSRTTAAMPRRLIKRLPFTAALVGTVDVNETHVLSTHVRSLYAEPDTDLYLYDRVFQTHTYELKAPPQVLEEDEQGNDISTDVLKILQAQYRAARDVNRRFQELQDVKLISHVLNRYDGPAFDGRDDGKVGPYGVLTRSETLVFQIAELIAAYGNRRPIYLGGTASLPNGTPQGFASDLGYREENNAPYVAGYYVDIQRHRYDFQETNAIAPHGLAAWPKQGIVTAMQDPRHNTTTIRPDRYWFLSELVQDAASLETKATYNYRVMLPETVSDANGNKTNFRFSAQGLLLKQWLTSRNNQQGGTEEKPEVEFVYDFRAYDRTRETEQPQPVYAHVKQRIWHASDNRGEEGIDAREYSDGFGRLLQKRAQAEELAFDESGDEVGLPGGAGLAPSPAIGKHVTDRVIVSGWQIYDNKGRVVEKYEHFFSKGWDYESEAKHGEHAELIYDPRGQVICTLNPDGSEQRVIAGIPPDLSTPQDFAPTPWETYTYDPNDLASITNTLDGSSLAPRAPATHYFTPASVLLNAQGKVIAQIARNGAAPTEWYLTRSRYDLRGNLMEIIDALGRTAFRHTYDLLDRPLSVDSIDAGLRTSILDAQGSLVEFRDSNGSVILRRYDMLNRPIEVWAVDDSNASQQLTQREKIIYGDQTNLSDALDRNLLGQPYQHYDEAGVVSFDRYDFKGNLLEKLRRVITDSAVMAGWQAHWEDGAQAETDLDPVAQEYQTSTKFDALNRPIQITYPHDTQGIRAVLMPIYNRAGNLQAARLGKDDYVRQIAYNAKGQRVLIAYGNNVMTRYAYNRKTFRLMRLRSEQFTTPAIDSWLGNGPPLQDYAYSYDLTGNILSIEERVPSCGIAQPAYSSGHSLDRNRLLREFEYDPLYRLVSANGRACKSTTTRPFEDLSVCGSSPSNFNQANAPDLTEPYSETYRYDPVGNMLELTYHSGTNNQQSNWTRTFGIGGATPTNWQQASNNRLTRIEAGQNSLNAHTYLSDDNGNLKQQDTDQVHTWNHADQMIGYRRQPPTSDTASVEARYLYSANGIRVKKWVRTNGTGDGESTVYIDGIFEHQRWGSQIAVQNNTLHILDNQGRIALVLKGAAFPGDGVPDKPVRYHLGDHLDNNTLVIGGATSADNAFVNREEYTPYGETTFGSFGKKRYRLTGKERDEESGLYYHGARYYAPWVSRWVNCDRVGNSAGVNGYVFCSNTPLVLHDLNGLWAEAGHYWTVYAVSVLAGFSNEVSYQNAFFAQMPDEVLELDAQSTGKARFGDPFKRAFNALGGKAEESKYQMVFQGLHALTGGDVNEERSFRQRVVLSLDPGTPEFGLSLHAFGDSYPHARDDGSNKMHGGAYGHGKISLDLGTNEDKIEFNKELYGQYVRDLYNVLRTKAKQAGQKAVDASEFLMDKMIEEITQAKDEKEQITVLRKYIASALKDQNYYRDEKEQPRSYAPENESAKSYANFAKKHPEASNISLQSSYDLAEEWSNPFMWDRK